MGRIVVRDARAEDVDVVSQMVARLKRLNEELDPHFRVVDNLEEEARRYVEEAIGSDRVFVLVAEDSDGGVVGVIIVRLVDRIFYEPRLKALITDLYVKPSYRRKRVGALLVDQAIKRAESLGAGIVSAVYPANNAIAENFYESRGFSVLQVERYKPVHG